MTAHSMGNFNLDKLKLPAVSEVGLKVMDIVSNDDVNVVGLAHAISSDPTLSATILKYANSPLYRRMVEVTNVRNAISILGLKNVRLAVAVATMRAFCMPPDPIKEILWRHSFRIASLVRLIGRKLFFSMGDDMELTALMHDMGELVLSTNFQKDYTQLFHDAVAERLGLRDQEQLLLGVESIKLLDRLAAILRLPDVTVQALCDFYQGIPLEGVAQAKDKHRAILELAHHIEWHASLGSQKEMNPAKERISEPQLTPMEQLMAYLKLNESQLEEFLAGYKALLGQKYSL